MIPLGPVVARSRMNAARATVWAHLTDPDLRLQWWDAFELESGLGGAVRSTGEAGELVGVVDVWVAGHALGFTWSAPGAERGTAVLMTLRSQGYQTGITVTETGFDSLADGAARAELAGREWARFVEALAAADLFEIDDAVGGAGAGAGVAAGASVAAAAGAAVAGVAASEEATETDADADADADVETENSEPSDASDASELELAPLEVEGEYAVDPASEPIEVDAEPGLGDHLELVTGPIDLPSEGLVPLVLPEPNEVPLVLPEPPADVQAADAQSEDATVVIEAVDGSSDDNSDSNPADNPAGSLEDDEDDEDDEPDFESLLRGLL